LQAAVPEPAGPLRRARGFPAPGLLRALRPTPWLSADDAPARHAPARTAGTRREPGGGSHVHHLPLAGL